MTESRRSLVMATAATAATVAQLVGFWRYLDRLPEDRVGLTLYVVTIALFAAAATHFFGRWRDRRRSASPR